MTLTDALGKLKAIGQSVFRTADVMAALDVRKSHASKLLARLAQHEHVLRLKRGLWTLDEGFEPLALVPHVTAPFPSYVSFPFDFPALSYDQFPLQHPHPAGENIFSFFLRSELDRRSI